MIKGLDRAPSKYQPRDKLSRGLLSVGDFWSGLKLVIRKSHRIKRRSALINLFDCRRQ